MQLPAFELECWHAWMDPLGHVNHPAYVDWFDEALFRAMTAAGLEPVKLAPVAERVAFRSGVVERERVTVDTALVGQTAEGDAAFEHTARVGDRVCAKGTSVRRLVGEQGPTALLGLA